MRPTQVLFGHFLMRHRFYDVGAGDEHVAGLVDHDDKVGDRWRVHRSARARTQDRRQLRHHARGQHVAGKDLGVAGQRLDAFLNAGATGVIQANHRRANPHRQIHHFADLLRVGPRQRAAKDRKVLGKHKHLTTADQAVTGDHAVTQDLVLLHPEVDAAMGHKLV